MIEYTFITDGAYSSSRNQGGASVVILKNKEKVTQFSRSYKNCTNNQMEVIAIMLALLSIKSKIDKCIIITDSMYALGCASLGWKRKKNIKLWQKFDEIYNSAKEKCPEIIFKHVKGHSGDKWNELADQLAVEATQCII